MNDDTTIRLAAPADAAAITGLLRSLGLFHHLEAESPEATARRVARHLALCLADGSHTVLVAESGGVLAAYCAVHWLPYLILTGPEGYVSELFVEEGQRGRGLGAALLDAAAAEGRHRGCSRLNLLNNRQRDSYQRGFYAKRGWEERTNMANFVLKLDGGESAPPAAPLADSSS
jgi:GNAT superfamily N-acetyltransferase